MVKNKKGGSSHKKMARKHVNPQNRNRKLRLVKESGEMYGKIVKIEGGGNFEVLCNDNKRRLMIIRKKFKGRNKRDNTLRVGTMVMVGTRDWQVMSNKKREKVDLLEVYKDSQLNELSKDKNINLDVFPIGEKSEENWGAFEVDDGGELNEEDEKKLEENIKVNMETIKEETVTEKSEFNWDDI